MKHCFSICIYIILLLSSPCCTKNDGKNVNVIGKPEVFFAPDYSIDSLEYITSFDSTVNIAGPVAGITEVSGIDKSLSNPGKFWVHNDGGHEGIIFLLDGANGECLHSYRLNQTKNIDWEDITTYRDLSNNIHYLYIGDIGDNTTLRKNFTIYKIVEPVSDMSRNGDTSDFYGITESIVFQYPGKSYNAETIMADPLNGNIILATYTQDSTNIFEINPITKNLRFLGILPISKITGGDISEDRKYIILKTFRDIFIWEMKEGESISSAFKRIPKKAPYKGEPQGEAICWFNENYYTLSEKVGERIPELHFYLKK